MTGKFLALIVPAVHFLAWTLATPLELMRSRGEVHLVDYAGHELRPPTEAELKKPAMAVGKLGVRFDAGDAACGEASRQLVSMRYSELEHNDLPICASVWEEVSKRDPLLTPPLWAGCSSTLIEDDVVLTAAHCLPYLWKMGPVVFGHTMSARERGDVVCAPREMIAKIDCLEWCDGENDLATIRIRWPDDRGPAAVSPVSITTLSPGEPVEGVALFSPLGLPVVATPVRPSECEDGEPCYKFDNAQGGSGGGIFTMTDDEWGLVGVVLGMNGTSVPNYSQDCQGAGAPPEGQELTHASLAAGHGDTPDSKLPLSGNCSRNWSCKNE